MKIDLATIRGVAAQTGLPESTALRIAVEEGFLRRAALVDGPFMLKGSYVTRQRIDEGWRRIPGDLDWVGLEAPDAAALTAWVKAVTDADIDDGVHFRSFSDGPLWRRIEYAVDEDFLTINTDIAGWIDGQEVVNCRMDVSFGLRLDAPPQPMLYRPQVGAPFSLRNSVATELQVAWKLHQCLARPRFKDMLDLIFLIGHNELDEQLVWTALENDCGHQLTLLRRFDWLLDRTIALHPAWEGRGGAEACFQAWHGPADANAELPLREPGLDDVYVGGRGEWVNYDDFVEDLACALRGAGFRHVPSSVAGVAAQPPRADSATAREAPPNDVGAIIGRWFKRRR